MKKTFAILLLLFGCIEGKKTISREDHTMNTNTETFSIYQFKIPSLTGDTIDFSNFRGKKLLLVNTASECGFTPQYEELQKLHEQYGDKVVVLGFPSNDFGGQEPGSHEEIQEFCRKNYGVTFQMFQKITVKGSDKHPLYKWLTNKDINGWNTQEPSWNFCKYLVNEKGNLVKFLGSGIKPMSTEMLEEINK